MLISLKVENSRFGMSLLAIKQNEPAAEAAGIDTWRWKMLALMLSGALAAMAGGLYAVVLLVVTPETVFGMLVSAQALILALFGGVGSLWGPVIGAMVLVPLAEGLNAELGDVLPGIQGVVYGVAIIAIILLAPEGVYWRVSDRLGQRAVHRPAPAIDAAASCDQSSAAAARRAAAGGGDLLVLRDIGISFGGLRALDGIDLSVPRGRALRHHRPERRRQDDAVQRHQRLSARPTAARSALPASRSSGCARTRCAGAASAAPFRSCAPSRA